jgi:hypothetical protein
MFVWAFYQLPDSFGTHLLDREKPPEDRLIRKLKTSFGEILVDCVQTFDGVKKNGGG